MILIFGPTGSGKSMQGKFLAVRNDWQWLSAGQLLRDEQDQELSRQMKEGELIDFNIVNNVVGGALTKLSTNKMIVLDGYPRMLEQAKYLIESKDKIGQNIDLALVLDVPRDVVISRLQKRSRADDNLEAVNHRLDQYEHDMPGVYDFLKNSGIDVVHVNGDDTIGIVHDRVMQVVKERNLA